MWPIYHNLSDCFTGNHITAPVAKSTLKDVGKISCQSTTIKQNIAQNVHMIPQTYCNLSYLVDINSLAPGRFYVFVGFKFILVTDGWDTSHKISSRWMSLDLTDKSTLVQVMAWCRQAPSHYLSQWWPRSLSPYAIIRPQWVKALQFHYVSSVCENAALKPQCST